MVLHVPWQLILRWVSRDCFPIDIENLDELVSNIFKWVKTSSGRHMALLNIRHYLDVELFVWGSLPLVVVYSGEMLSPESWSSGR